MVIPVDLQVRPPLPRPRLDVLVLNIIYSESGFCKPQTLFVRTTAEAVKQNSEFCSRKNYRGSPS